MKWTKTTPQVLLPCFAEPADMTHSQPLEMHAEFDINSLMSDPKYKFLLQFKELYR